MTIVEFLLARIGDDEAWRVARYPGDVRLLTPVELRDADRYLAETKAKRRIVEWADEFQHSNDGDYVLRELAAVYADHPDYDQAWAL